MLWLSCQKHFILQGLRVKYLDKKKLNLSLNSILHVVAEKCYKLKSKIDGHIKWHKQIRSLQSKYKSSIMGSNF